jgi:hypothetical protein
MPALRPRRTRIAATAAALVVGVGVAMLLPAGTALAAAPAAVTAPAKTAAPTITATAAVKTVKPWTLFRISGKTANIKAGTTLTVEQLRSGHWAAIAARTTTAKNGTFGLQAELGIKGKNELRLVGDGAVSNTMTVDVS